VAERGVHLGFTNGTKALRGCGVKRASERGGPVQVAARACRVPQPPQPPPPPRSHLLPHVLYERAALDVQLIHDLVAARAGGEPCAQERSRGGGFTRPPGEGPHGLTACGLASGSATPRGLCRPRRVGGARLGPHWGRMAHRAPVCMPQPAAGRRTARPRTCTSASLSESTTLRLACSDW
jgi:hypothetical protein